MLGRGEKQVGGRGWERRELVGCLASQQHASVSQGQICSDSCACCHTEVEVAEQTCYLTQSYYADTGPTSHSSGPVMPGAWQGSHWSASVEVTGRTGPTQVSGGKLGYNPRLPLLKRMAY